MKNKFKIFGIIISCVFVISLIIFAIFAVNKKSTNAQLDRGAEITGPGYVMLSVEEKNITITAPGEYILTGENTKNSSVIIESTGVTLILENAVINSGKNAGIINLSGDELLIVSASGTTNQIIGGNPTRYNAPIYSNGNITIGGSDGTLVVGNQQSEESPMILTENDKQVTLTDSTIVGLDLSDWAAKYDSSRPNFSFNFNDTIKRNNSLVLSDSESNKIFEFDTKTEFKKMLINSSKISAGTYNLYQNDKKIASEVFE